MLQMSGVFVIDLELIGLECHRLVYIYLVGKVLKLYLITEWKESTVYRYRIKALKVHYSQARFIETEQMY